MPAIIGVLSGLGLFIYFNTYTPVPNFSNFGLTLAYLIPSFSVSLLVGFVVGGIASFVKSILSKKDAKKLHNNHNAEAELLLPDDSEKIIDKDKQEDTAYKCVECGADIRDSDSNCPKCGVELEEEPLNKDNEENRIFTCDKCEAVVGEGDVFCPKCGDKFEDELLQKDNEMILEESKPYLNYRPHNCPSCDSAKISESVMQVAKNEKEIKLLGYSYLWEGKCSSCSASWYSVEGGKQLEKNVEIAKDAESETNYCFKCGRAIKPEMVFCPKCGFKLT
ncbi:zinc ribbon domain-containing protein [Chloroflexota bacterium]